MCVMMPGLPAARGADYAEACSAAAADVLVPMMADAFARTLDGMPAARRITGRIARDARRAAGAGRPGFSVRVRRSDRDWRELLDGLIASGRWPYPLPRPWARELADVAVIAMMHGVMDAVAPRGAVYVGDEAKLMAERHAATLH